MAFFPSSLIVGPYLECEVWISRNDVLSGIDFITDSLSANLPAKCSYGDLNLKQYFISDSKKIF